MTRIKPDGTVRHYVRDALGSVIALTDDTGVVKTTYTYDAFGNTTATGETSDNPFQYTGRENDGTGLYYYRFRYYSPQMQRFINEDPIRLGGGLNFYAYVKNKPLNLFDAYGLQANDLAPPQTGWYPPAPHSACEAGCITAYMMDIASIDQLWNRMYDAINNGAIFPVGGIIPGGPDDQKEDLNRIVLDMKRNAQSVCENCISNCKKNEKCDKKPDNSPPIFPNYPKF